MLTKQGTTIITGGASGIGLAAAQLLLKNGQHVLVLDHSAANLAHAEADLAEYSGQVGFGQLDITDETRTVELLQQLADPLRPWTGLVNSAGFGKDIPFLETTSSTLRAILEVNLIGTFNLSREVALQMARHGGGAIVHIASVSGQVGNKGRSAYGASKAALINLTQVMANELAQHGIRVNCVCPGPVSTPLAMSVHTAVGQETWQNELPMKRYGNPEEIAQSIDFLLDGSRSSFITGQILSVDGGFMSAGLMADTASPN